MNWLRSACTPSVFSGSRSSRTRKTSQAKTKQLRHECWNGDCLAVPWSVPGAYDQFIFTYLTPFVGHIRSTIGSVIEPHIVTRMREINSGSWRTAAQGSASQIRMVLSEGCTFHKERRQQMDQETMYRHRESKHLSTLCHHAPPEACRL